MGIREITASENEKKVAFHDGTKNNTDFHKLQAVCDGHIFWKSIMYRIASQEVRTYSQNEVEDPVLWQYRHEITFRQKYKTSLVTNTKDYTLRTCFLTEIKKTKINFHKQMERR